MFIRLHIRGVLYRSIEWKRWKFIFRTVKALIRNEIRNLNIEGIIYNYGWSLLAWNVILDGDKLHSIFIRVLPSSELICLDAGKLWDRKYKIFCSKCAGWVS